VTVDGEVFLVQVESLEQSVQPLAQSDQSAAQPKSLPTVAPAALAGGTVKAPMPGTIVKINVNPGQRVEVGQELCVLEAMKMNNAIRASRPGQVIEVRVAIRQSVRHGDVLIVLSD
jgi:biotin carboxyl carrier protein